MFGKKKTSRSMCGTLITGLPVPEGTFVQVVLTPEGLALNAVLQVGGKSVEQKYSLNLAQIKNIYVLSEAEVQQIITQSAPGMILGAAAFGIIGAMIGGRVKTKEKTITTNFLILDYFSGEEKQITLYCTKEIPANQAAFLKFFRVLKPEIMVNPQTIQL